MDVKRLKEAYHKLDYLDERLTHKVRPGSGSGFAGVSVEHLDRRLKDLATYTLELKQILHEVVVALQGPAE